MTTRKYMAARINRTSRTKRLNAEALKLVEEKACEIAASLMRSTSAGHVMSTRLLVELAEGNPEVEEALMKRPFRSLALRLEAEPQMPPDVLAETEFESRELILA